MPSQPTVSDLHVNRPLTQVMMHHTLQLNRFAFNQVFPVVGVQKQSDSYYVWDRNDIQRDDAGELTAGSAAPRTVARLSTDSYNCRVYAIAEAIDDQQRANADAPISQMPDLGAAMRVAGKIALRMERRWVERCFTTGVWKGSTKSGGADLDGSTADFTQFASPSTGSPVSVLREQIFHLAKIAPMEEIVLTLAPDVARVLLDHDDFIDRLTDNEDRNLTPGKMANILGIGRVVIPMAGYSSVKETQPSAGNTPNQNSFVFSDDAMLLSWAPAAPSIKEPSAGYTFAWEGLTGSMEGQRILRYRDENVHSDIIEAQGAFDPKVTAPEFGIFFTDCLP